MMGTRRLGRLARATYVEALEAPGWVSWNNADCVFESPNLRAARARGSKAQ